MSAESDRPMHHDEEQRRQWDAVAAGWRKWWPTIEGGAQRVSLRMLELAQVRPGQRVLDLGTGIGEPALSAARCVGPSGRVVATDFSPRMLDIAQERAAAQGLANVEFIQADAATLDVAGARFDAILCRWGVTSLPDPPGALAAIRRLLVSDGWFVTAVWPSGAQGRPMASLAAAVAQEMFGLPPSASDASPACSPARVAVQETMRRAGFRDVHSEEMTMPLEFSSAADCGRYLMDVSPEFSALLGDRPLAQRAEFGRRLSERLQPYATVGGAVRIPNLTICAAGRR
ncbi:class I SAM-dependent methyltransferase [Lysobacter antibioticus]|uniref:class I SAM-dependent methyltransferase n=1 Tax=Lysobacter antibioticus TaxID=84531 RepID=UPI0009A1D52D|nr:methyltransferase domain-containing protein [Lysobacter antibioticus]